LGLFWESSRLPWDERPPSSVSTHRSGAQVLADPHVPSLPTSWLLARGRQLDAAAPPAPAVCGPNLDQAARWADVHAVCHRRRERLGRPLGSSV